MNPTPVHPPNPRARGPRRLLLAGAAVLVVAVGAATTTSVAAAAGSTVDVGTSTNFGSVLTNAGGFALYTFPSDHNGMSACTGPCATVWPALTVPAGTTPTAGSGVSGTVAAVVQANGTYQVTYNGAPLYTFVSDTTPGQVSGNGVGGFTVVQVSSAPPAPTTTAPAPTTPTTAAPAGTATTSPAASSGRAAQPVTAAAGSSAGSTSSSAAAGGTLALTGPGPSLMWLAIVGAGLITVSLSVLGFMGQRHRRRRIRQA